MEANHEIYRAIAELAYAVAKADGNLQSIEKETFFDIIQDELHSSAWSAQSRFDILEESMKPSVDHAYKMVIKTIKDNQHAFTAAMRQKFLTVMNRVAESYNGIVVQEQELINRFLKDTEGLVQS